MKLLNAAMMPQDGHYVRETISLSQFCDEIRNNRDRIESFIGYEQNVDLIGQWTGVAVDTQKTASYIPKHIHPDCASLYNIHLLRILSA